MVEIDFTVVGAEPVLASVSPAIELELEIKCSTRVAGALVRAQVRIEAAKRSYDSSETERLRILFGARRDWHRTLKSVLWTQIALPVPAFENTTRVPTSLPLCHDFSAAVTQYVQGLESGTLPLSIVFSGMVFVEAADGALRAEPISWASEARYELPLSVARAAIERHYAGSVPLWLEKDTVERLFAFRAQHGLTSFEGALDRLLASGGRSE
jgi:hypothetical protein